MSTEFLSSGVWKEITAATKAAQKPCLAAVAYFAKGASRRLPLPKGSRLVVNASENNVKSGTIHPKDLLTLLYRGVRIFHEPSLHAKVFVLGKTAYAGSTNVSDTSASLRIEAALRTTEPEAVRAAREFVNEFNFELGSERLKDLQKLYREPQVPGGKRGKATAKRQQGPTLPRVFLVQLEYSAWSDEIVNLHETTEKQAKKKRQHPRSWVLDEFPFPSKYDFVPGDVIIQVFEMDSGQVLVAPPGYVRFIATSTRIKDEMKSIVYLERPKLRRKPLAQVANKLQCNKKSLRRNGKVRDKVFAQRLLRELSGGSFA